MNSKHITKIILMFSRKSKILQAAPVLLNPYPLWNQENDYSILFPFESLDVLLIHFIFPTISDRFPKVDYLCALIFILWLPLKSAWKLELQQTVHQSYKLVNTTLRISVFTASGMCNILFSASNILGINWR